MADDQKHPTTARERMLLAVLTEVGGFTSGAVAKSIPMAGETGMTVRPDLIELSRRGLVRLLDDQKPVCWCRTVAGTAAVEHPADFEF